MVIISYYFYHHTDYYCCCCYYYYIIFIVILIVNVIIIIISLLSYYYSYHYNQFYYDYSYIGVFSLNNVFSSNLALFFNISNLQDPSWFDLGEQLVLTKKRPFGPAQEPTTAHKLWAAKNYAFPMTFSL